MLGAARFLRTLASAPVPHQVCPHVLITRFRLRRRRINLGLDLAGGSQLLLEADARDAAKQRLRRWRRGTVDRASPRRRRPEDRHRRRLDGQRRAPELPGPRPDPGRRRRRADAHPDPAGRPDRPRDWDVHVVDSTRIVLTPTDSGSQGAQGRDDRRPRRRPPPHRSAGHQGNHRHQPGRAPDPRPGARRRGSRGAEGADRPDRAARVQAGRPDRRPRQVAQGRARRAARCCRWPTAAARSRSSAG
jgi:hypothetical protein